MPHSGQTARGRTYVRLSLAERFWPKLDRNGPVVRADLGACHLWTGATYARTGYGSIRGEDGKTLTAHLAAWLIAGKPRPAVGFELCHKCDVRLCANQEHLFLGTRTDNMQDMSRKGRAGAQLHPERLRRGAEHPQAKLTDDAVRAIRALAGTATQAEIGSRFGVSGKMVGYIIRGVWWRHVA